MSPMLKKVLWFVGLIVFSFVLDLLALKSGFPYGYFWYGSGLGPASHGVPVLFSLGFPALYIGASAMANRAGVPRGVPFMLTVAVIILAAALVIDPVASEAGLWIFRNGGEYLNVPVGNFVGWLFVGSLAAFLFPNRLRSEKAVALLLLIIALAAVAAIIHGLILPAIFGILFSCAVAWFDLKKHGWQSGENV